MKLSFSGEMGDMNHHECNQLPSNRCLPSAAAGNAGSPMQPWLSHFYASQTAPCLYQDDLLAGLLSYNIH